MSNLNLSIYHDAGFSTAQMRGLEEFLSSNPLHWIHLNPNTGIYELILDNQMMSDYRQCASYFVESHINGLALRGGGKPWPLLFGEVFHYMIESYYKQFRDIKFDIQDWAVSQASAKWNELDLDQHRDHKEYKSMGGLMGFVGLITAYAIRYSAENERLRVIATEISFGHGKEVHLGNIETDHITFDIPFLQCYLSGRIDLLVDTGDSICPLDHKTMGSFRFDPSEKYAQDEGPTGYIYAVDKMIPSILPPSAMLNRSTNKIIMNYISKEIPKEKERFKRESIYKTTEQLETYRRRMLVTQEKIFRDLVAFANGTSTDRDTSKCKNWFMHDCTY